MTRECFVFVSCFCRSALVLDLANSGFDELTRGGLDLVLSPDDTYPASQLQSEVIYEEELVCVVAAKSAYTRRLTIKEYLEAEHVGISGVAGSRFTPEKLLGAKGHKRRVVIRVSQPAAAIRCVPGTILVATVPRRLALVEQHNPAIRILQSPAQLSGLKYSMIWHPRGKHGRRARVVTHHDTPSSQNCFGLVPCNNSFFVPM